MAAHCVSCPTTVCSSRFNSAEWPTPPLYTDGFTTFPIYYYSFLKKRKIKKKSTWFKLAKSTSIRFYFEFGFETIRICTHPASMNHHHHQGRTERTSLSLSSAPEGENISRFRAFIRRKKRKKGEKGYPPRRRNLFYREDEYPQVSTEHENLLRINAQRTFETTYIHVDR